jgi:hypothetical protein
MDPAIFVARAALSSGEERDDAPEGVAAEADLPVATAAA